MSFRTQIQSIVQNEDSLTDREKAQVLNQIASSLRTSSDTNTNSGSLTTSTDTDSSGRTF